MVALIGGLVAFVVGVLMLCVATIATNPSEHRGKFEGGCLLMFVGLVVVFFALVYLAFL